MTAAAGVRVQPGSAAHQAMIAELDAGLGPFEDPAWRADLALLTESVRATAVQWALDARTLVALAARVPRSPGDDRGGTPWTSFVREVALARQASDQATHAELALCLALVARHPCTLRLLGAGGVAAHRARALVEHCLGMTDRVVEEVERQLPDRLPSLTPARIRQEVDRIALRLDAQAAARKEAVASAGRTVSRRSLPDGQGEIALTGPAAVVQRWWDALTEQARARKAAGDPRSLGALRFDLALTTDPRTSSGTDPLLTALGLAPVAGEAGDGRLGDAAGGLAPALTQDARALRPVQALINVPAATALGLSDEPGWLDGHGWISAPQSRLLLTIAELRKACTAPHTGQLIDLADAVVRPRLTPTALRDAIRTMVLTPHELRDVVVDAQDQHDPSSARRTFLHARDRFCDGPTGTRVPARRTDSDHDRRWPTGPTAAHNLASRARRTHQLKHFGWTAVRTGAGTRWTSPGGQSAFAPAHHHPPERLPPQAELPEPQRQVEDDVCLVHPLARAQEHLEDRAAQTHHPRPGASEPARTQRGWPDEPAF